MCECETKLAEALKRIESVESVQREQSKCLKSFREILRVISSNFLSISDKTRNMLKQDNLLVKKD